MPPFDAHYDVLFDDGFNRLAVAGYIAYGHSIISSSDATAPVPYEVVGNSTTYIISYLLTKVNCYYRKTSIEIQCYTAQIMKDNRLQQTNELEQSMQQLWEEADCFEYQENTNREKLSKFLVPPNASGHLHIGNALMVGLQDILARYYRSIGRDVLWVPSLDHGGYETQVTYERELEAAGVSQTRDEIPPQQLYDDIHAYVEEHKSSIVRQLQSLGASLDWSRLRYTLDSNSVAGATKMFSTMVADNLIVRKSYMLNYCPECSTNLAEVELKKTEQEVTKFKIALHEMFGEQVVVIDTVAPELLFSLTHIIIHPNDTDHADLIGLTLKNPLTDQPVEVVASRRAMSWHQEHSRITPLYPSFHRYDYEYAVRYGIPTYDYFDWNGKLTERYPGMSPRAVRDTEIKILRENNQVHEEFPGSETISRCKKGHETCSVIRQGWFLEVDNSDISIRQKAIDLLDRDPLLVLPNWRKKGLVEWISKMPDWPISRQNVWGVRIPIWYKVESPEDFMVWFFDDSGVRHYGTLQSFFDQGFTFEKIVAGLQQIYAPVGCEWVTEPNDDAMYIQETDTLDTWFSSAAWRVYTYGPLGNEHDAIHYPSDTLIIGHDLLRMAVARQIMISAYLTDQFPFKSIYFHPLIQGEDGQKMSKSLGNNVSLDEYLDRYGADVTRMALVSYLDKSEDFLFADERLMKYVLFRDNFLCVAKCYNIILAHGVDESSVARLADEDYAVVRTVAQIAKKVAALIEKLRFTEAQHQVVEASKSVESLAERAAATGSVSAAVGFIKVFKQYLTILHPFAPHVTEAVFQELVDTSGLLAELAWPVCDDARPKRTKSVRHKSTKDTKQTLRDILKQL